MLLRGFNIYGETLPWTQQQDLLHTVMSFVNFTKYPPSLDFLLMTLGVGFLLLSTLRGRQQRIHSRARGVRQRADVLYLSISTCSWRMQHPRRSVVGANYGESLGLDAYWPVWVISLALVPVMYYPCRAFARYKRTTDKAWARYF